MITLFWYQNNFENYNQITASVKYSGKILVWSPWTGECGRPVVERDNQSRYRRRVWSTENEVSTYSF